MATIRAARLRRLIVSGALAALAALSTVQQPLAQAAPTTVLWGAYIAGVPWDSSKLAAFEDRAGKGVSIVHWGQPWSIGGAVQPFRTRDFQSVRDHGSIPMVTWASWDSCCGTNQPSFRLAAIINGTYDAYITRWAQAARAWGHPFFLRFDHEMNGWWQFPWSEQLNDNRTSDYVRAWRHVHDIFTREGATNATWVWCPNVTGPSTTPLTELYPGDDYVDWTAMDGYNWGSDKGNQWQSFSDIFGGSAANGYHNTYQELLNLAPGKPIMIGEVATSHTGGDASAWVRDALVEQLPTSFPQIKALVWFNWNAGDDSLSWPLESSTATQSAFAQSIASSYFAGNEFSGLPGGPVAPLPVPLPPDGSSNES